MRGGILRVLPHLAFGLLATLAIAMIAAQWRTAETGGGLVREVEPTPIWVLYFDEGVGHRRIRYWRMQMSGQNMMIPEEDFAARKLDFDTLPAHLRPESLDDLFIYAMFGESGWPMAALVYAADDHRQSSNSPRWKTTNTLLIGDPKSDDPLLIPLRPVWLGLIVDTGVYGLLSFGLFCGVAVLRRIRRRLTGNCPHCGYDLTGVSGLCPECGRGPSKPETKR